MAAFRSYYGAFLCVAWSPDSRFVLVVYTMDLRNEIVTQGFNTQTGGEDDLVSIFDPFVRRKVVARGQAHGSWITQVAFDPYYVDRTGHTRPNMYRFGSVAEDGLFMLWDFVADSEEVTEPVVPCPLQVRCVWSDS